MNVSLKLVMFKTDTRRTKISIFGVYSIRQTEGVIQVQVPPRARQRTIKSYVVIFYLIILLLPKHA